MFLKLASKSLLSRKGSVLLTLFAMTVSIFVMLGVEHTRQQAKTSFTNAVSGVDLIVGAPTGKLNLLLYSVFRIGSPTNNISWQSYQNISNDRAVKWTVPISLGDSHKGYKVIGTSSDYFKHFSYGNQQRLMFSHGEAFKNTFDVVLGADVANQLGYKLGDKLTLSHGIGATSFAKHTESPFTIIGILKPTGTPVDQSLHVSLQGLEAVHLNWPTANKAKRDLKSLEPQSITAFLVGLKSKMMVFNLQRTINTRSTEPMMAVLPGVALAELWQTMKVFENTLGFISILVFVSSLLGLSAILLSSIKERQSEIRLLRTMGASPFFIYWFIELEALLITLLSALLGLALLFISIIFAQDYLVARFGLFIDTNIISAANMQWLGLIFIFAFVAAIPPSLIAFKEANQ